MVGLDVSVEDQVDFAILLKLGVSKLRIVFVGVWEELNHVDVVFVLEPVIPGLAVFAANGHVLARQIEFVAEEWGTASIYWVEHSSSEVFDGLKDSLFFL